MKRISAVISVLGLVLALTEAKPIMVTFGTTRDPVQSRSSTYTKPVYIAPKTTVASNPAPVSEEQTGDVPNPTPYRPLQPHQYRTKLYAVKPPSNLILGTPLDQKYTPSIGDKYEKQARSSVGVSYTGPHVFERQEYEYIDDAIRRKTTLLPSKSYEVPQIGIVYSSGVRYYIPQFYYQAEEQENSVYDQNDRKVAQGKQ